MTEQDKAAATVSQQPSDPDEMQEIFAQLNEGVEKMDRNFRIHEQRRSSGAASNER
jgi:hypothetical protein